MAEAEADEMIQDEEETRIDNEEEIDNIPETDLHVKNIPIDSANEINLENSTDQPAELEQIEATTEPEAESEEANGEESTVGNENFSAPVEIYGTIAEEAMKQAIEEVEAGDKLYKKESLRSAVNEEEQEMEEERMEEQIVVEDRTEDQVPDITGTDNVDVMTTSMDGIEEIPGNDDLQQGTEVLTTTTQASEEPLTSVIMDAASDSEAPPIDEEAEAIDSETKTFQEIDENEAEESDQAAVSEAGAVAELEEQKVLEQDQSETEQVLEELQYNDGSDEISEVIQEVSAEQSPLMDASPTAVEELAETEAEIEETKPDEIQLQEVANAENMSEEGDQISQELGEEQIELQTIETTEISEESTAVKNEDENSTPSTPQTTPVDEQSDALRKLSMTHSSRKSSSKMDENNGFVNSDEFVFDEEKPSSRKTSTVEEKALSRKTSDIEEKIPSRKVSAIKDKTPSRKSSVADEKVPSRKTSTLEEIIPSRKASTVEEIIPSRKTSTIEEIIPSRKTSTVEEIIPSRKASSTVVEEKAPSRKMSNYGQEKVSSRKTSVIDEVNVPSRQTSVVEEKTLSRNASTIDEEKVSSRKTSIASEKTPSRKTSKVGEKIPSRKVSAEEERISSRKSSVAEKVPSRKASVEVEEKAPSRKTSKSTKLEEEGSKSPIKSTQMTRSLKAEKAKTANAESLEEEVGLPEEIEAEKDGVQITEIPVQEESKEFAEETVLEESGREVKLIPVEDEAENAMEVGKEEQDIPSVTDDRKISSSSRGRSPSPIKKLSKRSPSPTRTLPERSSSPIRKPPERSPSPTKRQAKSSALPVASYIPYDQDTYRTRGPPPRMPTYSSFSSHIPVEKPTYSPISPWLQNSTHKYRNEYTVTSTYRPPSTYTSIFDDIVSSGPFASSLYATSRLLERSRSRSRELRNALRSKRSASNYYRYTSNYATPPFRTRDYSTPPLSSVHRAPSRSGSFMSFMDYSGMKQYELARSSSRISGYDGLSRASSRSNIEMFYDTGRISRVDSYVRDLDHRIEQDVPSTYAKYRSPTRQYLPHEYTPVNGYRTYNNPSSVEGDPNFHIKRYGYEVAPMVRSMYESRIVDLERSLSRERLAKDRIKARCTDLSYKLEQACKQMDLLRTNSYSSIRGGTGTYSVYGHNYSFILAQIHQAALHLAVCTPVLRAIGPEILRTLNL